MTYYDKAGDRREYRPRRIDVAAQFTECDVEIMSDEPIWVDEGDYGRIDRALCVACYEQEQQS